MNLPENLILKQMLVGPLDNFLYFLGDADTKEIAVVDPAWDVDFLCEKAEKSGFKITAVFLTHGHDDHVNGVETLLSRHDVPVYVSKYEAKPKHKNIIKIENYQKLKVGNIEFECIHTPGHTSGSQCFKYKNILITGDVIFIDGCGRCDLAGGDASQMYNTLYDVLMKLSDDTVLYTGHDYGPTPFATLKSQKKTNPYLRCKDKNEFLRHRGE